MRPYPRVAVGLVLGITLLSATPRADTGGDANIAAEANNSWANMTAFNLQNDYIGRLAQTDQHANQFWLRFAKPFTVVGGTWLMPASLFAIEPAWASVEWVQRLIHCTRTPLRRLG